jgi:hypothetical protein
MGHDRDTQSQNAIRAGTSRSTAPGSTAWSAICRLAVLILRSKAKSAFPVHSILSLTSSTAITTVTLFGGRHAGLALHLINSLKPVEFGAVSRRFQCQPCAGKAWEKAKCTR